jgi:hypothetical protein
VSLTAGCGNETETTTGGTREPSVTAAVSSTVPRSTTTGATEATTVAEQVTTTAPVQATASTAADGDRLIGRILDTQWIDDGMTQIYLVDGVPIGLTSGTRLPLAWRGDEVVVELGFADWSGIGGNRASYGQAWNGELLLLEVVGRRGPWERYLVRDHEPVTIPAGGGFTAAMCFENGIPHAVEVRFDDDGPDIVRAWKADLDRTSLESVPVETLGCPDLQARPIGPGSVGAIVTPSGYRANIDDDCGDMIDITGSAPIELPYTALGGCMVDSGDVGDIGDDLALSVVRDSSLVPGVGWIQLEAFLGWDFGGAPLWRILDARSLPDLDSISLECWTADGTPAVATVEGPITDPTATEAWSIDRERVALTAVDPATVTCDYLGD